MNHQTDRELLELAAKAAGITVVWREWTTGRTDAFGCIKHTKKAGFRIDGRSWNPLTDDGDALRLAVKLGLSVEPYPIYQPEKHSVVVKQRRQSDTMREANPTQVIELYGGDPYAAARRAITRAAAEVAKAVGAA